MQEQSQAPALGGKESLDSLRALEGLVQLARSRGARIMLLMTWGYKEGDPAHHRAIFPDYHAMQAMKSCIARGREGLLHVRSSPCKWAETCELPLHAGAAYQWVFVICGKAAEGVEHIRSRGTSRVSLAGSLQAVTQRSCYGPPSRCWSGAEVYNEASLPCTHASFGHFLACPGAKLVNRAP